MARTPSCVVVCLSLLGLAGTASAAEITDPELLAAIGKCDDKASRVACVDIAQQLVDTKLFALDQNTGAWNKAASAGDLTTVGALLIDAFSRRIGEVDSRYFGLSREIAIWQAAKDAQDAEQNAAIEAVRAELGRQVQRVGELDGQVEELIIGSGDILFQVDDMKARVDTIEGDGSCATAYLSEKDGATFGVSSIQVCVRDRNRATTRGKYALDIGGDASGWHEVQNGGTLEFDILDPEGEKSGLRGVVNPTDDQYGKDGFIVFPAALAHELATGTPSVSGSDPIAELRKGLVVAYTFDDQHALDTSRLRDDTQAEFVAVNAELEVLRNGLGDLKDEDVALRADLTAFQGIASANFDKYTTALDWTYSQVGRPNGGPKGKLQEGIDGLTASLGALRVEVGGLATKIMEVDYWLGLRVTALEQGAIKNDARVGKVEERQRREWREALLHEIAFPSMKTDDGSVTYDVLAIAASSVDRSGYHVDFGDFDLIDVLNETEPVPSCSLVLFGDEGNEVTSHGEPVQICISEKPETTDVGTATISLADAYLLTHPGKVTITTYAGN